jgi:biotin transport system substrate-specific component
MSVNQNVKVNNTITNIYSHAISNNFVQVIFFSILTAIAAQVTIPAKPVPFTLQTMAVVLGGAFLGPKKGAYSQLLYLGMGSIGLPVFAQVPDGYFGFASLFGPTGGYLLSFPLAAYLTGLILLKNKSYMTNVIAMFAGNILILVAGAIYLDTLFLHNISESLKVGAVIFSLWTVIKVIAAATIYSGFTKKK